MHRGKCGSDCGRGRCTGKTTTGHTAHRYRFRTTSSVYTHMHKHTQMERERGEGEVYMQYTDLSLFRDIIGQDAERECLLADSSEELQCGTCGEHVSTGIS